MLGTEPADVAKRASIDSTRVEEIAPSKKNLVDDHVELAERMADACNGLAASAPFLSCKLGLLEEQRCGGWGLLGAFAFFLVTIPHELLRASIAIASSVFAILIVLRLASALAASLANKTAPDVPTGELPRLTCLVPLYHEANMVTSLVGALTRLNYPVSKLQILILIEADDVDTLRAFRDRELPTHFDIIPVPVASPRTKPKALNYGMAFANGDVIAIFDAEDRPHPDQPLEAAAAFKNGSSNLAVVQAPLAVHNPSQSWLSGQFGLEYAIHFRVWLPFLARLGWPLPLGGTSNYFQRKYLDAARRWDAWNVTEDADLGYRLARMGCSAETISLPTLEEAPVGLTQWMNQRTRWMKGHLQTWFVLMRSPLQLIEEIGIWSFVGAQVVLFGSLVAAFLHGPIVVALVISIAVNGPEFIGWHGALFGLGYGSVIAAAINAPNAPLTAQRCLTLPLYWPLLSIALFRALWEIKSRPHYWAKTPHGLNDCNSAPLIQEANLTVARSNSTDFSK